MGKKLNILGNVTSAVADVGVWGLSFTAGAVYGLAKSEGLEGSVDYILLGTPIVAGGTVGSITGVVRISNGVSEYNRDYVETGEKEKMTPTEKAMFISGGAVVGAGIDALICSTFFTIGAFSGYYIGKSVK